MGSRGMVDSIKFNKQQKSSRRKMFDRKNRLIFSKFQKFEDHKKMKGHEFALFQKDLFRKVKLEKKMRRIIMVITVILTILVILSLPFLIRFIIG